MMNDNHKYSLKGIRFNCILPSKIIKPSNKKFFYKDKKGIKIRKLIESITPLGRMGSIKDVANLAIFLTNDQSNYITGQSFIVDGGLSLISQEAIANFLKKKNKYSKFYFIVQKLKIPVSIILYKLFTLGNILIIGIPSLLIIRLISPFFN